MFVRSVLFCSLYIDDIYFICVPWNFSEISKVNRRFQRKWWALSVDPIKCCVCTRTNHMISKHNYEFYIHCIVAWHHLTVTQIFTFNWFHLIFFYVHLRNKQQCHGMLFDICIPHYLCGADGRRQCTLLNASMLLFEWPNERKWQLLTYCHQNHSHSSSHPYVYAFGWKRSEKKRFIRRTLGMWNVKLGMT